MNPFCYKTLSQLRLWRFVPLRLRDTPGLDPARPGLLGKETEDPATLPSYVRRWQSARNLKSLIEWDLRHGQSDFATLPHLLK